MRGGVIASDREPGRRRWTGAGEGVAKKEMARRTGLSVPTVRKYLKMIDFSFSVW